MPLPSSVFATVRTQLDGDSANPTASLSFEDLMTSHPQTDVLAREEEMKLTGFEVNQPFDMDALIKALDEHNIFTVTSARTDTVYTLRAASRTSNGHGMRCHITDWNENNSRHNGPICQVTVMRGDSDEETHVKPGWDSYVS